MGLTPNREELTCPGKGLVAKWSLLPQNFIVEHMEKENGELP
jgi:hypothetical protein